MTDVHDDRVDSMRGHHARHGGTGDVRAARDHADVHHVPDPRGRCDRCDGRFHAAIVPPTEALSIGRGAELACGELPTPDASEAASWRPHSTGSTGGAYF